MGYGLAGDAELAGAGSEQLGGAQPAGLQPLAFLLCHRAARNGWRPDPPIKQYTSNPAHHTRQPQQDR
jgi:hypothetical protein